MHMTAPTMQASQGLCHSLDSTRTGQDDARVLVGIFQSQSQLLLVDEVEGKNWHQDSSVACLLQGLSTEHKLYKLIKFGIHYLEAHYG